MRRSGESPSPHPSPSERPLPHRHSRTRRPLHNRHSRAGGNPGLGVPHEDRKNRPHLNPSPSERPLPHRHSRTRRPLHNRHSRAGGNPAFGGSPRGSKESPSPRSFSQRETIAPPSFPHKETVAQPSFPRRRESRFGGSPRGSKESPSPRFSPIERPSRNRCPTVIPAQPLHNRHSRAGGNPGLGVPHEDRKNRPHLDPSPSERPSHRHSRETVAQPSFPRRRESRFGGGRGGDGPVRHPLRGDALRG